MDIEQVLPHVLECIDQTRLGPRKVELLELVYIRQAGQRCSVHLGLNELRALGRSRAQAGYDRRALAELVRLGMLRVVPGRGRIANGYSLREPRLWDSKRIAWLAPREQVVSFFWRLLPRDAIFLSRVAPGQTLFLVRGGSANSATLARVTAGHGFDQRAATEFHRATSSGPGAQPGGRQRATNSGHGRPPTQLLSASKEAGNSDLEEEEERRLRDEANQLGRVIAGRIGKERLWGRALDPVEAAVRLYPDHVEDLYHLAVTVPAEILSPAEAAATFEAIAAAAAAAGWPHPNADRIAGLQRRIAVLEDFAPDAEQLPELRAELDRLRLMAS